MKILDGKTLAELIQDEISQKITSFYQKYQTHPSLTFVLIGQDKASHIYVQKKSKACKRVGIKSQILNFNKDISFENLKKEIFKLNKDSSVHGTLVQLPLPQHLQSIPSLISPEKDVDGLTFENVGKLWSHQKGIYPCTPCGIIRLLEHYHIPIEKKHAVVVGRSSIVGRPMASLLLQKNATVTLCHSQTQNLKEWTQKADIVVVACGKHHLLNQEYFKKGATVIDVGIHRKEKIEGDVCPIGLEKKLSFFSPVPGGVGPMTIALLLENTYKVANRLSESSRHNPL